jgi:hypothetical protein
MDDTLRKFLMGSGWKLNWHIFLKFCLEQPKIITPDFALEIGGDDDTLSFKSKKCKKMQRLLLFYLSEDHS